jgi:hypothetical protein
MDNGPDGRPAPRYYGTVAEWGACYDFIHDNPQLFDGYGSAPMVGVLVNADTTSFDPVRQMCRRLTELQVPFQVIVAAARFDRAHLSADLLRSLRFVIGLSPEETYAEEDRKAIAAARDSLQVRFLKPEDDIEAALQEVWLPRVRIEGPKGIYAFLRVKPGAPSALIHVVNWNTLVDKSAADPFSSVTLSLSAPEQWGKSPQMKYYLPGQKGGVDLQAEAHPDSLRVTLPRLETWGVLQIQAEVGPPAGKR